MDRRGQSNRNVAAAAATGSERGDNPSGNRLSVKKKPE